LQPQTFVSPTLYVFRQIISQIADIDAVLERPEMRYLPSESTSAWRPPDNPYVKRWLLEKILKLRGQFLIMQKLTRGLRDAGVPAFSVWRIAHLIEPCDTPKSNSSGHQDQQHR
jgi:hypothetical protein